ncbi:MAG: hypothetical protein HYY16_07595 [Planctomycetes bacterium]|nr:hypothetical protein [Planctomycetota bacterium]
MDAQPTLPSGASPRVGARWARANPYRTFLRRRIRLFLAACAVVGLVTAIMGLSMESFLRHVRQSRFDARDIAVPPELRDALVRAAQGDHASLATLIPKYPHESFALLVDQEHAPESMDFRNPLSSLGAEESDRLLRELAPLLPLRVLRNDITRALDQPRERSRVVTILKANPTLEASRLLEQGAR